MKKWISIALLLSTLFILSIILGIHFYKTTNYNNITKQVEQLSQKDNRKN